MRSPLRALANRSPVPYAGRSQLRLPMLRPGGAEQQMRAMGSVGTLFAIVDRLASSTAAVNWGLYRQAQPGQRPEDRVQVTAHAAADIWARPNPFFTQQLLTETVQQHYELVGEGWWVVARHQRMRTLPLELWPVRPDRIEPIPSPTDYLTGYVYKGPDGQEVPLQLDEVIHMRRPNPVDPYRGIGAVQTILADLEGVALSAEWNRNFFRNSAEPGGIVEVDRRLSDDEFEEMTDRWREQHQGVAAAHRVAILEGGAKWVDRKLTQRDMQFAELRGVGRDVIREAFGITKFAIGDVEDINRATGEAAKAWFAEQMTVPRVERLKQMLNSQLLPLFGPTGVGVEFDYESPVPADAEALDRERDSKSSSWATLVSAGADPDDAADAVGLPRMKVIKVAPVPAPVPPGREPEALPAARVDIHHHALAGPAAPVVDTVSLFDIARARTPRPLALTAPAEGDDGDDEPEPDLEGVRVDQEAALERLLGRWDVAEDEQIDALAAQITAAIDGEDLDALAALSIDATETTALLREALAELATTAARRMVAEAAAQGVDVDAPQVDAGLTARVRTGGMVDFGGELRKLASAVAGLLGADLARQAGQEALRLYAPGAAGRDVAYKVKTWLRGLAGRLRRDQLGGALHRATNLGRIAVLDAAPPATYTATEVLDRATCAPCSLIDGTEWTDLTEVFAAYGRGPYHACEGQERCRGTVTANWP